MTTIVFIYFTQHITVSVHPNNLQAQYRSSDHLESLSVHMLMLNSEPGYKNTKDQLCLPSMTEPLEIFSENEESELSFSSLLLQEERLSTMLSLKLPIQ